jgi:hypothetical protein
MTIALNLPPEDKLTPIEKLKKLNPKESGRAGLIDLVPGTVPLPAQPSPGGTLRAESGRNELLWPHIGGTTQLRTVRDCVASGADKGG